MEKYYQENRLISAFLLIYLTLHGVNVMALSTDKDQPIEIEANSAELDDKKGVTVYYGDVVVIQGSIRMTGDKMTVHYNQDQELETVVLTGQPATYKQLPDNSKVYDEAEALIMEYHELESLIVLKENARVKQEGLQFSGKKITYDTVRSRVKAEGGVSQKQESGEAAEQQQERVKITIKPKKKQN